MHRLFLKRQGFLRQLFRRGIARYLFEYVGKVGGGDKPDGCPNCGNTHIRIAQQRPGPFTSHGIVVFQQRFPGVGFELSQQITAVDI